MQVTSKILVLYGGAFVYNDSFLTWFDIVSAWIGS